ncbi:MAG: hypothetical protein DMD96_05755 [Candidatus Rokuibacteriota bacterium]|nr:MAG: hypothetical protein DMD96_05755 [Candidatus Rokubacteria bacterium]
MAVPLEVSVRLFGLADGGMPELVTDPPEIGARLEHPGRIGVPHRVRRPVAQFGRSHERLPHPLMKCLVADNAACLRGEDEFARDGRPLPHRRFEFHLLQMFTERVAHRRRDLHPPRFTVLAGLDLLRGI